jgi:hypothetical protein
MLDNWPAYSERSYFGSLIGILHPYSLLRVLAGNAENLAAEVVWQYGPLLVTQPSHRVVEIWGEGRIVQDRAGLPSVQEHIVVVALGGHAARPTRAKRRQCSTLICWNSENSSSVRSARSGSS